ncbi:MAG: hypothetical protein IJC35_02325 [Oscillospiraceae bacterium]|nr:hypothetical protein [Oscillospiraceae bacterium]
MKRVVSVLLLLAMLFLLTACGKSAAVKAAEEAIDAIGEVTVNSGEAVANAKKLYELLTEDEKAKVRNRVTLIEAEEAYGELADGMAREKAEEAFDLLREAAAICISGVELIERAWYFGIHEADDYGSNVFIFLAMEVPFTSTELEAACNSFGLNAYHASQNWDICVMTVIKVLQDRGDYTTLSTTVTEAETILNDLKTECDDDTYYPVLMEYLNVIDSYANFFASPSGSYSELGDTMAAHEGTIASLEFEIEMLLDE